DEKDEDGDDIGGDVDEGRRDVESEQLLHDAEKDSADHGAAERAEAAQGHGGEGAQQRPDADIRRQRDGEGEEGAADGAESGPRSPHDAVESIDIDADESGAALALEHG